MRKTISTTLATALLLTGLYVCWVWFTVPVHVGGAKYIFVLGPFMTTVGAVWLASDWFDCDPLPVVSQCAIWRASWSRSSRSAFTSSGTYSQERSVPCYLGT